MRRHYLRLGQQTVVYGLSGVALQFIGVITVPVMARVFSTAQYGMLELITTAVGAATIFVDLGLASAAQRSYYDYSDNHVHERRVVLSTATATSVGAAVVMAAILIGLRHEIAHLLFDDGNYSSLVIIAALSLPLGAVMNLSREIMRLRFRAWHYFASSLLSAATSAGFIIVALLILDMGLEGALLGGVIGASVAAVYGSLVIRREVGLYYSLSELRIMFAYGLPLVLTGVALWALALIDRFMLLRLSNLSEVGEYAMANRLALMVTLAATAFGTAFSPWMLSMYADDPEEEKQVRAKVFIYMTIAFALITVVISLYAREILLVIAPRFRNAYEAVGMVTFGTAALGISSIALAGITLARQTRTLVIYASLAAAVNIALNFVMIPVSGMVGAAFATAAANVLLLVLYYRKAQQVYHTPYPLGRVLRAAALTTLPVALGAVSLEPLAFSLGVKTAALIAFVISLLVLRVVEPHELSALRLSIRARLRPSTL